MKMNKGNKGAAAVRLIRTLRATRGTRSFPYKDISRPMSGFPRISEHHGALSALLRSSFSRSHWTDKQYPRPVARHPTLTPRFVPSPLPCRCPLLTAGSTITWFQHGSRAVSRIYKYATRRESFHPTHPRLFSPLLTRLRCPPLTLRSTIQIPSCLVPRGH